MRVSAFLVPQVVPHSRDRRVPLPF
jgi:hypothetical protein